MSLSGLQREEEKSWFLTSFTWLSSLHTCCAFCPHHFPLHGADGNFSLSIFTQIFSRCAKTLALRVKCLPSERDCHCKHVCMHPHISDIHSLLCRWASNTEAFKMLIHCYSCLFLQHVYSLLPEWGDPKASLFFCSYQVDISTKSRSLSTTKKKNQTKKTNKQTSQKNSKCNKL